MAVFEDFTGILLSIFAKPIFDVSLTIYLCLLLCFFRFEPIICQSCSKKRRNNMPFLGKSDASLTGVQNTTIFIYKCRYLCLWGVLLWQNQRTSHFGLMNLHMRNIESFVKRKAGSYPDNLSF